MSSTIVMWLCALCWLVLLGTPSGDAVIIVELPAAFNASRVQRNTGSSIIRANRPSSNEPQLMLLVPVSLNDNMGTSRSLVVGEQGRSIMKKAPRQFNQRQTPVFKKKNKKSRSTGPPAYTAVCDFDIGAGEDPNVGGRLILTQQTTNDPVTIMGKITNLATGKHGFHIHTFSDFSNQCVSAGGHYDPLVKAHGSPDDSDRHIGDLGNIVAGGDRVAFVDLKDSRVTLGDVTPTKFPIVGRSIVVHEKEDDLGRGSGPDSVIAESKKTGNAGKRLRCCAIRAIGSSDQRTPDVILVARSNVKQPLGEFASWAVGKWLPYKTFDVVYQFPDNIFDRQRAVFTAPETGLYSVHFSVWRRPIPGNSEEPWIAVVKNVRDIGSLWRPNLDNAAGVISATGGSLGPQGTLIASGTVPLRRGDILQAVTWGVFRNLPDWFNSDAFEVKLVKKLRDDQIIGS